MADIIQAQIIDEEIVTPSADPVAHNMPGGGAVESVNGKTGAVVLTADDVGAVAAETFDTAMQGKQDKLTAGAGAEIKDGVLSATSLGITGAVVGQIGRITAVDSEGKPTAWEPVDMPSGGGVESVNGKTGAVVLTAEDVGAISKDNLQTATNEALAQAKASGEFDGADGKTPEYGVDYGTQEQIADIANQAAEVLLPEVNQIKDDLANINTATAEDVGKYLKAKTVTGGKVTEWEFGGAGGGSGWVKAADITYNSNKEVVVESIDYELGIFTSTNHGLQDGENVFFVPNGIYKYSPEKYMPVGTLTGTEYKVTNATENTFSIVGVTMTANQEIDFTKWHLETNDNYGSSIFIKNLTLLNDVKVISYGKTVSISTNQTSAADKNNNVLVTVGAYEGKLPNAEFYDGFGNIGYEIFRGTIFGCCETVVTRIDKTHIRSEITALSSNSKNSSDWGVNSNITHAVAIAKCLESAKHPTEIKYWNFGPANGYRIEVYTK